MIIPVGVGLQRLLEQLRKLGLLGILALRSSATLSIITGITLLDVIQLVLRKKWKKEKNETENFYKIVFKKEWKNFFSRKSVGFSAGFWKMNAEMLREWPAHRRAQSRNAAACVCRREKSPPAWRAKVPPTKRESCRRRIHELGYEKMGRFLQKRKFTRRARDFSRSCSDCRTSFLTSSTRASFESLA